jgi:hypothetical protein
VGQPLAPEDHDVVARVAQRRGQRTDVLLLGAGGPRERADVAVRPAERRAERRGERLAGTGSEARAECGVGVQRRGPAGGHRELHRAPAHALAQSQIEDRRVVHRLAVQDQHGVGELEIGDRGLHRGRRERLLELERQRAAGARVEVGRAQALPHQALQEEALLVGGAVAGERADVALRPGEALRRLVERTLPAHRPQVAAVAHHRPGDALVDVHRLVGEAALVAQPAVVDLLVVAGQHAQDALVAHGEADVALRRAQRADRAGALDVPRARAEAVRARRQRAHRAELDDVAAERGDVRVAVEGRHVGVRPAFLEDQLVVLGDLLAEAHAAVAQDAALTVDGHQR